VPQAERHGLLDVGGDPAAPAGEAQVAERARLLQRHLRPHVGHLVEEEREADLGLRDAEAAQVPVDHRLAELGQPGACGLHAIAVGHVQEMHSWHATTLTQLSDMDQY
jgi:hypothetical protein